ncbi:MAG: helix-turn-helix domain-containing protein, partial [Inquilinus sp.]|nr:helix-turn-helix domain-containing protein [Inquilinus sp.]
MNVSVIPEDDEPNREDGAPAAGVQQPICVLLREAREAAGYSIADVAQLLRIQRQYLAAIEEGRYSDLPGSVYAIGFVRTYSDFLNLDADEVVRRFKDEAEDLSRPTDYVFPVTPTEARVPGFAVLVIGVLLAALAYSAWYLASGDGASTTGRVTDVPARVSDLASRSAAVEPPPAIAPVAVAPPLSSAPEPVAETVAESVPEPAATPVPPPAAEPVVATAPAAEPAAEPVIAAAPAEIVEDPTPP